MYNTKVDIWATGCILFEFAVGKKAFPTTYSLLQFKLSGTLPEIPLDDYFSQQCKASIRDYISMLLKIDLNSRPTAAELVERFGAEIEKCQSEPHEVLVQIRHTFSSPLSLDTDSSTPRQSTASHPRQSSSPPSSPRSSALDDPPPVPPRAPKTIPSRQMPSTQDSSLREIISASEPSSSNQLDGDTASSTSTSSPSLIPNSPGVAARRNANLSFFDDELPIQYNCHRLAIQENPFYYEPWLNLYKAMDLGLTDEIRIFTCAAHENPSNPGPLILLTNLHAIFGDYESAVVVGTQLQTIDLSILRAALPINTLKAPCSKHNNGSDCIEIVRENKVM